MSGRRMGWIGCVLAGMAGAVALMPDVGAVPIFLTGPAGVTNPSFFTPNATVITFDTLPAGTLVGSQYQSLGIIFEPDDIITAIATWYPRASEPNTLGGGGSNGAQGPIGFHFVDPLNGSPAVTTGVGFFNPDTDVRFEIFDINGASLASAIVPMNVFAAFFESSGIGSVSLTDATYTSFVIDNLTFGGPGGPPMIPEPATGLLAAAGLIGLALRRKAAATHPS